ncbi:MAG: SUMF1/EgtB/PvdO family nonheme iron enzyme [Steroidobacteraceae bacterium]
MSFPSLIVHEAGGSRSLPLPLRLAGDAADVALPAAVEGRARIESAAGQWWLRLAGVTVRLNGRLQQGDAQLHSGDVIEIGGAQLVLRTEAPAPRLEIYPLRGNETIAPLETVPLPGEEIAAGTREIRVAEETSAIAAGPAAATGASMARRLGLVALLMAAVLAVIGVSRIVPLRLDITPQDAKVGIDGWHWLWGRQLLAVRGSHVLEVASPGYRSERRQIDVDRTLAATALRIELAPLPGMLSIDTQGVQAEVLVDGTPAGSAPGVIELEAGQRQVVLRAPRHLDFSAEVQIEGRGQEQSLAAMLEPAWGWLEVDSRPAGAQVIVDGKALGNAPQRVELDSGLHQLELRAAGQRGWRSQVAITAGETLALGAVDLARAAPRVAAAAPPPAAAVPAETQTSAAAPAEPPRPRIQSPLLGTLILVPAGSFQQGSERREQGRRANETLRQVTLSQPFYLAEREVTNAQFRAFRTVHASGIAADRTLDLDQYAVSSVSWDDAVAFCNWLSQREGLPLAYERRDGRWQLVEPFTHGYRLPTEAEWEYAARYVDGRSFRRYSWGDALPPPAGAENLAGAEVNAGVLPARAQPVLPDYRDEHAVVAPVGSYARNALGFADMDGNVSEWMHDTYASLLPAEPVTDPRGDGTAGAHVIRGANWHSSNVAELRLAWRDRAATAQQTLGFRVARSAKEMP